MDRKNLVRVEFTEKGRLLHLKLNRLKPVRQTLSVLEESEQKRLSELLSVLCRRVNKCNGLKSSIFPFSYDGQVLRSTLSGQTIPDEDEDSAGPDRYLMMWLLLKYTSDAMVKTRHGQARKCGISPIMPGVFYSVAILGRNAIQAGIARYLGMQPHNLSLLITRMEKEGLVLRVKDMERKNWVRIELTEKGNDIFKKSDGRRPAEAIMSGFSDSEQEELWSLFAGLRAQAVKTLKLKNPVLYPPSDRNEFLGSSGGCRRRPFSLCLLTVRK
jgi:MarR family transcriptional regulator for hemolysin